MMASQPQADGDPRTQEAEAARDHTLPRGAALGLGLKSKVCVGEAAHQSGESRLVSTPDYHKTSAVKTKQRYSHLKSYIDCFSKPELPRDGKRTDLDYSLFFAELSKGISNWSDSPNSYLRDRGSPRSPVPTPSLPGTPWIMHEPQPIWDFSDSTISSPDPVALSRAMAARLPVGVMNGSLIAQQPPEPNTSPLLADAPSPPAPSETDVPFPSLPAGRTGRSTAASPPFQDDTFHLRCSCCSAECSCIHGDTLETPPALRLYTTTAMVEEDDSVAVGSQAGPPSSLNNTFDQAAISHSVPTCVHNNTIDIPSTSSLNSTTNVAEEDDSMAVGSQVALDVGPPSSTNSTFDMATAKGPSVPCVNNDTIDIPSTSSLNSTTNIVEEDDSMAVGSQVALDVGPPSSTNSTFDMATATGPSVPRVNNDTIDIASKWRLSGALEALSPSSQNNTFDTVLTTEPSTSCIHISAPSKLILNSTVAVVETASVALDAGEPSSQNDTLDMAAPTKPSAPCVHNNDTIDIKAKSSLNDTTDKAEAGSMTLDAVEPSSQNNTFDMAAPTEPSAPCVHNNATDILSKLSINSTTTIAEAASVALDAGEPSSQNDTLDMAAPTEPSAPCVHNNDTIDIKAKSSLNDTTDKAEAGSMTLDAVEPSSQNNTFDMAAPTEPSAPCVHNNATDILSKLSINSTTTIAEAASVALDAGEAFSQNDTLDMAAPTEPRASCIHNNSIDVHSKSNLNSTSTLVEADTVTPQDTAVSKLGGAFASLSVALQNQPDLSVRCKLTGATPGSGAVEAQPAGLARPAAADSCDDARTAGGCHVAEAVPAAESAESEPDAEPASVSLCDVAGGDKPATFPSDESLDLSGNTMVTSTPMPDAKTTNTTVHWDPARSSEVQRRLYGDGLCAPPTPANMAANGKTLLKAPSAAGSLLPSLRGTSHSMKYRPALAKGSAPGVLPRSGLPMARRASAIPGTVSREVKVLPKSTHDRGAVTGNAVTLTSLRTAHTASSAAEATNRSILKRPRPSEILASNMKVPGIRPPLTSTVSLGNPSVPTVAGWSGTSSQATNHDQRSLVTDRKFPPLAKRKRTDVVLSNHTESPKAPRCLKRPAVVPARQPTANKEEELQKLTLEVAQLREENGRLREENRRLVEENRQRRE